MKTAISMPDEVFREVEQAAKKLKLSRSEFLTRAAERFLATMRDDQITSSYDEAFAANDRAGTAFQRKATRHALLAIEWDES